MYTKTGPLWTGSPVDSRSRGDLDAQPPHEPLAATRASSDLGRHPRLGPISGCYYGEELSPDNGRLALELRLDIDPRHDHSPVTQRVSGDRYRVSHFHLLHPVAGEDSHEKKWRLYLDSFEIEEPTVVWLEDQVRIAGTARFAGHKEADTKIEVVVPWRALEIPGPAQLRMVRGEIEEHRFQCVKKSNAFRRLNLEVDVCKSVSNKSPVLPRYDTHAHPQRPDSLPRRVLTVEEAFLDAGIDLRIDAERQVIDDSHLPSHEWTHAELHEAMEAHFEQVKEGWPRWHVWCLVAGKHIKDLGGTMFDRDPKYRGGAGKPPDRQGCAVFRGHRWFKQLVEDPTNDSQAEAARQYLFTWVHELGHALNLAHSWDVGRPEALSWMNYQPKYKSRTQNDFFDHFLFRFDEPELHHLRHGAHPFVIPGGNRYDPSELLHPSRLTPPYLVDEAPIELALRSKPYHHFLEPVHVELRLRNRSSLPVAVDPRLQPEYGNVVLYVRRPSGQVVEFKPLFRHLAEPQTTTLEPFDSKHKGQDRWSECVCLSYGCYGFYFDDPGEYQVQAFYRGPANSLIPSNPLHLRLGYPASTDVDRKAADYFSYEAGTVLHLQGSRSPRLEKGWDVLADLAEQLKDNPVGAHLSLSLAHGLARPFLSREGEKLKEKKPELEAALKFLNRALEQHNQDNATFDNLLYHQCRRARATALAGMGKNKEAADELEALASELKRRGAHPPVLKEITEHAKKLRSPAG